MAPVSLLELPKELLSQILDYCNTSELCQPALVCGLLNLLCERLLYQSISVVRYAHSHIGETNYHSIRAFFGAIKKRPRRLSYIKEVNARLELRMDSGLYHACELFEALPKMPHLTDLSLEILGGIKPHRDNRSLEQSMIWGCTFERGRMAIYKFFRMKAEDDEFCGLHALKNLQRLKVLFPSNSIGLQTDLMAYSALQHKSVTRLELKHIINAALAPPKLPGASGMITHLTMIGCQLPRMAFQSIFESISALEHLEYRPVRSTGCLPPGEMIKTLARHNQTLRSLSIQAGDDEMMDMDLSAFTKLTHLEIHNPDWNENAIDITQEGFMKPISMPAAFPPFLEILTLKNFHSCVFAVLIRWMDIMVASLKLTAMPHLRELRLEAERLGDEYVFDNYPMYLTSASGFHVNSKVVALGMRFHHELGVKLCVKDTLRFGQEAHVPGSYETEHERMTLCLDWEFGSHTESRGDVGKCTKAVMSPKGAVERLLLLRGNTLNGQLSWQAL